MKKLKIAITGGTLGVGKALADVYDERGHEVARLSRRTGHDIQDISKLADAIEPCDVFVNNAQVGFAQTELLFEMSQRWQNTGKQIVVISSNMMQYPISHVPGMTEYYVQKSALEEAVKQIRQNNLGFDLILVRPGSLATENKPKPSPPSGNVTTWANALINILDCAANDSFAVTDITLLPKYNI
jgi:nucleoside-diphosphate-sugar epimerase